MSETAKILAEHYQKSYELAHDLWKQRNRLFLMLLGFIGVATLLTFQVPESQSLLVDFIAKTLGISDPARIDELRGSFPFGILQSILLFVVFYLMVNLHHRALYVLRSYLYLGILEEEIRKELNMPDDSLGFTREGKFYWMSRGRTVGWVKWVYIFLLGLLLFSFLVGKTVLDFRNVSRMVGIIDILVAVPTAVFFLAYAKASVSFEMPKELKKKPDRKKS